MKIIFITILFFIISEASFAQPIYTIPWATYQPKFVFPVYFEEASGMRDTVYFCYDSTAHLSNHGFIDSSFGQKPIYVDTNFFYAFFESYDFCRTEPQQCDSQYKVSVSPLSKDRKSTRLNSSHPRLSRMPSSA